MSDETYMIAGVEFRWLRSIDVSADEQTLLDQQGRAILRRRVEWPVPDRIPDFATAYIDGDPTSRNPLFGAGPYLKVPNRATSDDDDWVATNRVFCPWGYSPDQLQVRGSDYSVRLRDVVIERSGTDTWHWVLEVTRQVIT
jgi:hypothetical protein